MLFSFILPVSFLFWAADLFSSSLFLIPLALQNLSNLFSLPTGVFGDPGVGPSYSRRDTVFVSMEMFSPPGTSVAEPEPVGADTVWSEPEPV